LSPADSGIGLSFLNYAKGKEFLAELTILLAWVSSHGAGHSLLGFSPAVPLRRRVYWGDFWRAFVARSGAGEPVSPEHRKIEDTWDDSPVEGVSIEVPWPEGFIEIRFEPPKRTR
jgi:hypothetical protein